MSSATRTRHRKGRRPQPAAGQAGSTATAQSAASARGERRGASRPIGPVAPRLRAKSGTIGGIRMHQLVLVELAAALVLVGWLIHPAALVATGITAGGLVVLALGRRRRIPLPDWFAAVRSMKRRSAAIEPAPTGIDASLAPVVECEPGLRTYEYIDRNDPDQRAVGFVGDGTFLTALVLVEARDQPLRPAPGSAALPLALLRSALDVDDIRLESVQCVQYTQPAPAPHLPQQAVAARSYAPLQAQTRTPATRLTWIALKLDPELCPEAVEARGGGLGGAQRALLRAADQLASGLRGHGFRASVLQEREIVTAIGTAVCISPRANNAAAGRTTRRTEETSRAWRCDDRWHTTYWVGSWPQLGPDATSLAGIAALLSGTPAMATTFSLNISRAGSRALAIAGYVRLSARSENELTAAQQEVERRAASVKAGLVRLDREQLPGLLATLPLGGTR